MNKLIIFDLDGVLLDSREIHYAALNLALAPHQIFISKEEHLSKYDGLPTTKKLELLTKEKGLGKEHHNSIWSLKQKHTILLYNQIQRSEQLCEFMKMIRAHGIKIAVASNSVYMTLAVAVVKLGVIEYLDYCVSNQDVDRPKPYPEMYWKCMAAVDALPKSTVIIEDSHIGREGALNSGAHLIPVTDTQDLLTGTAVEDAIDYLMSDEPKLTIPWRSKTMNVLIPMAGAGSRFEKAGYTFPKPLIEVNGKPMIQVVKENLNVEAHYIFIAQSKHYMEYNLQYLMNAIAPGCDVITISGLTEGAACTTLHAEHLIDNDNPLLIANSDQFVEWNANEVLYAFSAEGIDGGIVTFKSFHPKWSYARLGNDGFVAEVAEKRPISEHATVGIYYWKHGSDYVKYAKQMIEHDIRVNGEFYVAPVFNLAINDGKKFRIKEIDKMWGLGTPEDLAVYLEHHK